MADIQITITEKRPQVIGAPVIVCGNSDYTITFIFDSEWSAGTKTARFVYVRDGAVMHEDVVFSGSTVAVPILDNVREVRVGVYAGNLQTSTPVVIPCECSIRCGTGAPADPTPSQYDQIIQLLEDSKATMAEIKIGGRNQLLNTRAFAAASSTALNGALNLVNSAPIVDAASYRGLTARGRTPSTSETDICRYTFTDFDPGDTFTFSFYAKGTTPEIRIYFYGEAGYVEVASTVNSQGEKNTNKDGRCTFFPASDWRRYWVTWTLKKTGDTTVNKYILMRAYGATAGQELYVCGCQMEEGNFPTAWSPAPEDIETRVAALEASLLAMGGEG